jgi:hypothetical protein
VSEGRQRKTLPLSTLTSTLIKTDLRMRCDHPSKHLVWTDVGSRGEAMRVGKRLRHQCPDCGELVGEFVAHAQARPNTPSVDKEKLRTWREKEDAKWRALSDEYLQQRLDQDAAWWAQYDAYLQSDAWYRLRPYVFGRADGICEGCRRAPATQVHHLTYKHVTNEFLWELVAVCDICHERVHRGSGAESRAS